MTVSATPFRPYPRAAPPTSGPGGREIRSLTGLRIVAAAWVVLFHLSWAPGSAYTRFWEPLLPLIRHGALGVDLFFVLSGFVITLTYLDKLGPRPSVRGALTFWWARICRIWPVYATVTAVFGAAGWCSRPRCTGPDRSPSAIQPVLDVPHWIEQMLMVAAVAPHDLRRLELGRPGLVDQRRVGRLLALPGPGPGPVAAAERAPLVTGALSVLSMVPWALTLEHAAVLPVLLGGPDRRGFARGGVPLPRGAAHPRTERVDRIAARVVVLATVEILVLLWADSAKTG